jgi:hypothetical protein
MPGHSLPFLCCLSPALPQVGCVVTIKVPEWQVHMALLIVLGVVLGVLQFIMHVQSHRNTMLLQAMLVGQLACVQRERERV